MFAVTNLFVYKMVFAVALIIAESLFLLRMNRKESFWIRFTVSSLFFFAFVFVFPLLAYNAIYCSFMFFVFFGVTIFTTKFCYDINWKSTLFCTVAGYSMQHLASVCYDVVITLTRFDSSPNFYSDDIITGRPDVFQALINIEVYALIYFLLYQLMGRRIKRNEDLSIKSPSLLLLLSLTVVVEIVLNAVVVYRKYDNPDLAFYLAASLANIMCTLSVMLIQFGQLLQQTLKKELAIVYQMWRQEQKQFEISKETIDLINTKCHNMKHQIHAIGENVNINPDALKEMEESIMIYDAIAKTGNQALDIILAEKSLYCAGNNIFISYVADGKQLNFMSETDIYSLFGNLLDNAIQTVIALDDAKRVISLTIKAEGNFVSVNSHNYYDGTIEMENGLPVTNKPDKEYHGFGVKSMLMIVEKYNGTISFQTQDQVFNLNMLFPREEL